MPFIVIPEYRACAGARCPVDICFAPTEAEWRRLRDALAAHVNKCEIDFSVIKEELSYGLD